MDIKSPSIIIAGCGPGSPEYLTPAVQEAVDRAEVLVGALRLLDLFPGHRAEKIVVGADIEKILGEIAARRGSRQVVVLVTGDPGLCSLARPILKRFGRKICEVIPGVSSVQVAFARLGIDWLDARIIDTHGENPDLNPESLMNDGKIAVFAGRSEAIRWVAEIVKAIGKGRRIFLCENLTLENEEIRQVQPEEVEHLQAASRSIILIIKKEEFGEPQSR